MFELSMQVPHDFFIKTFCQFELKFACQNLKTGASRGAAFGHSSGTAPLRKAAIKV
jgi:hypothetical protein